MGERPAQEAGDLLPYSPHRVPRRTLLGILESYVVDHPLEEYEEEDQEEYYGVLRGV